MTAAERRRRDAKIVADRARGLTWPELADRHGVGERTARRAVEAWYRQAPVGLEVEPETVVRETLAMLEQSIGDYALLSLTAKGEAVRLGAMKARDDAARHRIEVLQSVGAATPAPSNKRADAISAPAPLFGREVVDERTGDILDARLGGHG